MTLTSNIDTNIKSLIRASNRSMTDIAKYMKTSRMTLYRRLKDNSFTILELEEILTFLGYKMHIVIEKIV